MNHNTRTQGLARAGLAVALIFSSSLALAESGGLGGALKGVGSFLADMGKPPIPKPDPENQPARDQLSQLNPDHWIAFSPATQPKAHVYIYADPTCPYSRELHKRVPEFNAKGIEVRYLGWSTNQPGQNSAQVLRNVWCSDDRKVALDDAMKGKPVKSQPCSNNDLKALEEHYEAGKALTIRATPRTYYPDGHWAEGVQRTEGRLVDRAILGVEMMTAHKPR
ncbi:DsbC family protein [Geopseudomonas aromaticivorans]